MIEESRIQPLNRKRPQKGDFVLYWMQASQRAECNHALEYAIRQANAGKQPVVVYFGLTEAFPEANERHYYFMLEGLRDARAALNRKGIGMVIERSSPEIGAAKFARRASLVVCDRGYLKIQRKWREFVAEKIECPLIQVESDVLVPVETASNKEEFSVATLRRKIQRMPQAAGTIAEQTPVIDSTRSGLESFDISDTPGAISKLAIDRTVKPSPVFRGGAAEAGKLLKVFIETKLSGYGETRNDPNENGLSNLSPYLHFGQISPLYVALEAASRGGAGSEAFLEELTVRRELSMNFVHYNPFYDSFAGLPGWAKRTLMEHQKDPREYLYSREQLEQAGTHDPYWNAAQREMVSTGKMHGYMRMYWGKKILEWTATPPEAYALALYLNNKYELDGRDPNGYTGVAWCFGKHDRPWAPRPVFGNVRYMSAEGLKRKFDADRYAKNYGSNSR